MAPAASKTRDNQFFNVGVQGRKTGITLKDTGVRDEYGMEPIDGIFSSPEKSPPKRANARQQDKTLTSSDMDVQQISPARGKKRIHESVVDEETMLEESELQVNEVGADSPLPAGGDESLQMLEEDDATVADEEEEEEVQYSTEIAEPEPEPESEQEPTPPPPPSPPKARGKARRRIDFRKVIQRGGASEITGRISAKPVEFWRNERIEYAYDGSKKEIVRAEDVDKPKRPGRHTTSRKRTNKKSVSVIEEEEEELEPEDWEVNEGVLHGFVNGWDEKNHAIIDEGARPEELAYSAARLQTKEVAGATFRYAKIVGLPYFGAGMVDIPPNGCKRLKNSRRMFMAFCLMFGKVTVTVGDSEFSISKGGVWMVPRGE
ncbi:cupin domain-containing protein [Neofusicoccum parvum]|uniref:Cupin domain-containing protein n=1 Tax=Neofusicoccum parvum TaxID=310453 RepID=A0ACB5S2H3_9PEZI|nr:cupin domain-containing protein [Neofusicoccum parvum]